MFWLGEVSSVDAHDIQSQDCAAQAADIVGHAEVWCGHWHQYPIAVHMLTREGAQLVQNVMLLYFGPSWVCTSLLQHRPGGLQAKHTDWNMHGSVLAHDMARGPEVKTSLFMFKGGCRQSEPFTPIWKHVLHNIYSNPTLYSGDLQA